MKTLMKMIVVCLGGMVLGGMAAEDVGKTSESTEVTSEKELVEAIDDSGLWCSAGVDFLSDYVWRGIVLNDNPVWQPTASVGYKTEDYGGIYFNVWQSYDLTHKRNAYGGNSRMSCGLQEVDYFIGYAKSIGDFDFELGHYWYSYPNGAWRQGASLDGDLYFATFYNNPFLTPGFEAFWNYGTEHDHDPSAAYFSFSVKHEYKFLDDALVFTPKMSLGFGDHCFTQMNIVGYREDSRDNYGTEMTDQTTTLAVSYAVTEWLTLGANVNYTWVPSHSLRHERWLTRGHAGHEQLVWGGFSASVSF